MGIPLNIIKEKRHSWGELNLYSTKRLKLGIHINIKQHLGEGGI